MLLIRRRAGQSIRISGDIEIQITEVSPSKVTLGIIAPRDVTVVRSEVALTRDQNMAAAEALSAESLAMFAHAVKR
jgi:carbon storage regulator